MEKFYSVKNNKDNIKSLILGILVVVLGWLMVIAFGCLVIIKIKILLNK